MENRRVQKIMIRGFRSFGDQMTIDLREGAVCIADPEGNGIQDLSDALRFLAGRPLATAGDASELLHMENDMEDAPAAAEVSAFLSGDDEENAVTVSRILQQSGEDVFFIDGDPSEVSEVRAILSGSGIYGFSLIDKNSSYDLMTSRYGNIGMILGEASGAVALRQEAAETERLLFEKRRELEETEENLELCRNQKKKLLDEAIRVREYRKLSEMLKKNEINVLLRRIEQYERDSNTALIRISELNDRIAEKEKDRSEADLRITEKKIQQRNLENEETKARGVFLNGRNEIGDRKARMSVIDGRTETVNQNLDLLNHDLVILRTRLEKEKQNLKNLERQEQKTEDIFLSVSRNRIQTEKELSRKKEELVRKTAEYDRAARERDAEKLELSAIEVQLKGMEQLQKSFNQRREAIADALSLKENQFPDGVSRESDSNRLAQLKAENEKSELRMRSLEKSLEEIRERASLFTAKQEDLSRELTAAQSRRDLLSDQEEEYDSYDTEAITLLRHASIQGVHNTAGELIRVQQGYEEVISAALGRHLQDIVCADLDSASRAASFLRKQNAGRLTFIPLKELEYKYRVIPSELLIADGYQGRALDYVEYDADYSRVFQFLLGNTVIFRDFESAVNAGRYAGIQIVTMDHEVISDSEVVEGGSLRNSGTRILARRNNISMSASRAKDLEAEYQSNREACERALKEQAEVERQITQIREEIEARRADISEISLRTEMDDRMLSEAHEEIRRLKEELSQYDNNRDVTDLPGMITELRERFSQSGIQVGQLETLSESLYRQVDSLTVEIEVLEQQMEEYHTRLSSLETEQAVYRLSMEKAENTVAAFESDIQEKLDSIESIRENRTALTREKERLEQEVRAMEVELSDRVRILSSFQEDRDSLRSQLDRLINDRDKAEHEYIGFRLEKRALEVERDACAQNAEEVKQNLYETHLIPYAEALEMKESVFVLHEGLKESARLRNLLQDYEEINTSAPDDHEIITQRFYTLERQRSGLKDEIENLSEKAGHLRSEGLTLWRKLFESVNREFSGFFSELSESSRAEMRIEGSLEEAGYTAGIYVKKEGYTARKLLLASPEEKSAALASFIAALHSVAVPAVTLIDSIDDLLQEKDRQFLKEQLEKALEGSLIVVTDREEAAENAGNTYACLQMTNGTREFKRIPPQEFRVYTPDREL